MESKPLRAVPNWVGQPKLFFSGGIVFAVISFLVTGEYALQALMAGIAAHFGLLARYGITYEGVLSPMVLAAPLPEYHLLSWCALRQTILSYYVASTAAESPARALVRFTRYLVLQDPSSPFFANRLFRCFASPFSQTGVMNVSSDALNKGEQR